MVAVPGTREEADRAAGVAGVAGGGVPTPGKQGLSRAVFTPVEFPHQWCGTAADTRVRVHARIPQTGNNHMNGRRVGQLRETGAAPGGCRRGPDAMVRRGA